jgi:hypothetical protein
VVWAVIVVFSVLSVLGLLYPALARPHIRTANSTTFGSTPASVDLP